MYFLYKKILYLFLFRVLIEYLSGYPCSPAYARGTG